jgi:hypothetical protein
MRLHVKAFARRINMFVAQKSSIHLVFIIREPSMRIDVVVSTLQVGVLHDDFSALRSNLATMQAPDDTAIHAYVS